MWFRHVAFAGYAGDPGRGLDYKGLAEKRKIRISELKAKSIRSSSSPTCHRRVHRYARTIGGFKSSAGFADAGSGESRGVFLGEGLIRALSCELRGRSNLHFRVACQRHLVVDQ